MMQSNRYAGLPRLASCCLAPMLVLAGLELGAVVRGGREAPSAPGIVRLHEEPQVPRDARWPAAGHPGNVFVAGEQVSVLLSVSGPSDEVRWQAADERGKVVEEGTGRPEKTDAGLRLSLGTLPLGWYRVSVSDLGGKPVQGTTAAVIAPPAWPVPQDSPVCVDSATAWFANSDLPRQERFAQLAVLAGANWIRDRMRWGGMETARDRYGEDTTYDSAATVQARQGLKVLQVFHDTPRWATDPNLDGPRASGRFPRDLRVLFDFCQAMAQRYHGRVPAWESWNEANITAFGGHTIDEMCSLQKAAYLGFKAGDPNVLVCWNVYAGSGTPLHSRGVIENEVWPYFETYNIHSYDRPEQYAQRFAPAREAACGRPIWITECGVGLPAKSDAPWSELTPEDELKQATFIACSYASSLYAGTSRHFFFILGNYRERDIQFGVLRQDQTPRPGYVALAAVGRFLAGATCLGRYANAGNPAIYAYAFRACPDGRQRDVLVAWAQADGDIRWSLPQGVTVESVHDYLGRPLGQYLPETLGRTPIFVVLPEGAMNAVPLDPPLTGSPLREGATCPVVMQLEMLQAATDLDQQAHKLGPDGRADIRIFAYNFGAKPARGTVQVQAGAWWKLALASWDLTLGPGERQALELQVQAAKPAERPDPADWIKLAGDFGAAGRSVLAFRLLAR
jgi:hypothetical protein